MRLNIPNFCKKILVTGGAGFIGGCLIRRLLKKSDIQIFNIDKFGYSSNIDGINNEVKVIGKNGFKKHHLIKIDISDKELLSKTIEDIDPDYVFHFAAESHVDRSIDNPEIFIRSNILGTFNLLEVLKKHFRSLSQERKRNFRLHHVSTDEVFGSINGDGKFSEISPYNPQSPYSASKASSDHLVRAWQATYGLPISISNCSNNYGPWQPPDKLIPLTIFKAINDEFIPIYGDGKNIRDWIYVEDHVDAILSIAFEGKEGNTYCVGGCNEYTNLEIVNFICDLLNQNLSNQKNYRDLITFVEDRPGHDFRYALDNSFIKDELGWEPKYSFEQGLNLTVNWYLKKIDWCKKINYKIGSSS